MLKHRISDIYKDSGNLFSSNPFIIADSNLSFMSENLQTFDLITKYDFGVREILVQFLNEETLDYVLPNIHEAIYMNLLKNLRKYKLMYESDEAGEDVVPSYDYKITRQYGEETKNFNYGAKSATDNFGQKVTTDVLGQGTETITSAPRSTNSQDQRTTFDSVDDYDTTRNTTSTIQTIDTTVDAEKTNTTTEGQHNIVKTEEQHSDNVVYNEHIDNVYGYKGNPVKNIETFRKYLSDNTIKTIVAECINTVTYSMYLYSGSV